MHFPQQAVVSGATDRDLSIYVHVPFCASRCGYCDFNTYTPAELRADADGAKPSPTVAMDTKDNSREDYVRAVVEEIALAGGLTQGARQVRTIFFGGGTPTLLTTDQFARILTAIRTNFSVTDDCEITTESNPDSVTEDSLRELRQLGINRISFGMQSASSAILQILERTHTPGRAIEMVSAARRAGFGQVSVDLIFGTPTETLAQWGETVTAALAAQPDHVSAYSLIVESGTRFARKVQQGTYPMPDEDDLADKYQLAEELFTEDGFHNYEVSNWARSADHYCRHNLAYWRSNNWWGFGPGAHSHINGTRWLNVKLPRNYSQQLAEGQLPIDDWEQVSESAQHMERIMLQLRLGAGLALTEVSGKQQELQDLQQRGLVQINDRVRLTFAGRLLADAVIRELVD